MLWLVFTFGWLPALAGAFTVAPPTSPIPVLTAAGAGGALAGAALATSLMILGAAYAAAISRPPGRRMLLAAAAGSLLGALAMPLLFSADVYAYAYYGDLTLHGRSPYDHGPAPHDPLAAAAVAAWDGHVPPRCVYGPVAVGIAALTDRAGAAAGTGGQILLARLAAAAAYGAYIGLVLRLTRDPRARAAFVLNPVVIWSVAEGHNDAAMVALVLAGFAYERGRPLLFALAALVKVPALAVWWKLRGRDRAWTALLVAAGYLPLPRRCRRSAHRRHRGGRIDRVGITVGPVGGGDRPWCGRDHRARRARRGRTCRAALGATGSRCGVRFDGMVCAAERVSVVRPMDRAARLAQFDLAVGPRAAGSVALLACPSDSRCHRSRS